jgi:hypothetical protein
MEMFDTHRRDILNFDNYMDLKKPGFGGPKSAIELRDAKGNINDKDPKLSGFRRTVERDPAFSHPVYDPTYKAMTHDLVYKQEKKKPFTYEDPYHTAIPVIEVDPIKEGRSYGSFQRFINEMDEISPIEDEEDEYVPEFPLEDEEDEEEATNYATQSNKTMSNIIQIEDKLRSFEQGENLEDDEEFGANPDETPFGPVPDWVKELRK